MTRYYELPIGKLQIGDHLVNLGTVERIVYSVKNPDEIIIVLAAEERPRATDRLLRRKRDAVMLVSSEETVGESS